MTTTLTMPKKDASILINKAYASNFPGDILKGREVKTPEGDRIVNITIHTDTYKSNKEIFKLLNIPYDDQEKEESLRHGCNSGKEE